MYDILRSRGACSWSWSHWAHCSLICSFMSGACKGAGIRAVAVGELGRWRLPHGARRSWCLWHYASDWWLVGGLCPNDADGHTFRCGAVEGDSLFSWGHQHCGRDFLRKVLWFLGSRFWVWGLISQWKTPVCGSDFLSQVIGQSIFSTSERWSRVVREHNTKEGQNILCGNP